MKKITTDDLRRMSHTEGLILQGCGGDLGEWVTGISDILTQEGILLDGDTFKDVSAFEHDGLTNLLFSMERVKLDVGKLAIWRLKSHETFGGTWLSDYVPNRLGDFIMPADIHTSPDFQCDQTGGYPTVLSWNKDNGTAILEPAPAYDNDSEEANQCIRDCADWGIHPCASWHDYNDLLESIGDEAFENGSVIVDEDETFDEDQGMGGIT